jgi:hypothetical protein
MLKSLWLLGMQTLRSIAEKREQMDCSRAEGLLRSDVVKCACMSPVAATNAPKRGMKVLMACTESREQVQMAFTHTCHGKGIGTSSDLTKSAKPSGATTGHNDSEVYMIDLQMRTMERTSSDVSFSRLTSSSRPVSSSTTDVPESSAPKARIADTRTPALISRSLDFKTLSQAVRTALRAEKVPRDGSVFVTFFRSSAESLSAAKKILFVIVLCSGTICRTAGAERSRARASTARMACASLSPDKVANIGGRVSSKA